MVQLYVQLHGNINSEYGFIVPNHYGRQVKINFYSQPGTSIIANYGNMKDLAPAYGFSTGDFMFDVNLSVKHANDGFIKTGKSKYIEMLEPMGLAIDELQASRDNFVLFEGKDEEYIKKHLLFQPGKFTLSMLVFELIKMYTEQEIIMNIIACLPMANYEQCPSLLDLFNISSEKYKTTISNYSPKNQINDILGSYFKNTIVALPPLKNDEIIPRYEVMVNIADDIKYLIVRKSKAPILFKFLCDNRNVIKSLPQTDNVTPGLGFASAKSYLIVNNNNDKYFTPSVHIIMGLTKYIGKDVDYHYIDNNYSFEDTEVICVYAYYKAQDGNYKLVTHQSENKSNGKLRVLSSRGVHSIRGKLEETSKIIASRKLNVVDRLKVLCREESKTTPNEYKEGNIKMIIQLIEAMNDFTLHDVIVIPYYIICNMFFPNEQINYRRKEIKGNELNLFLELSSVLQVYTHRDHEVYDIP
jgi:hypothetical protein